MKITVLSVPKMGSLERMGWLRQMVGAGNLSRVSVQEMQDIEFEQWLTGQLASLPGVLAVALGGSRAQMTHRQDSDWDFAIYYRGQFEPRSLREKAWEGEVSEVGGWGGGVMNGGAWLTIDGRRVDVHYRDLDEVEHWCSEAEAGRFEKELLLFYVAGIPTYVVMAELAINRVLAGTLPRPPYPELLATSAGQRWRKDALASLRYAAGALRGRRDVTVALCNAGRGLVEAAHSTLAYRRDWALNEKGIVARAGLVQYGQQLLHAVDEESLEAAIVAISGHFATGANHHQFEAAE
jgi:predicted nucleotidyltransferase